MKKAAFIGFIFWGRGADCHSQCTHWLRNDRFSMECGAWQAGDREGRPYGGLQGVPCGRADRGVRPYGGGIDGAVCGGTHESRPTGHFVGQGPRALPGVREKPGRADVGIGPYGSATRGAMGGRPQGSPLRKRYKGCGKAGGVYRMCFKFVKKLSCLFGAVAVQCFRRFFASKFALHPG